METLAGLFVSLVMAANTALPNANIAQFLGVQVTPPSQMVLSERDESTSSGKVRSDLFKNARERAEKALEDARQKRENAIARAKDAREQFRENLAEVKDQRKQQVIENIDQRIANHNEIWAQHWNNVLVRLRELVVKIESNAQKLADQGQDISTVETAVAAANTAIDSAQAAVTTQAAKVYTIDITDQDNLGQAVRTTISQFHSDVKIVLESIRSARQAVNDAFQALRLLHTQTIENE